MAIILKHFPFLWINPPLIQSFVMSSPVICNLLVPSLMMGSGELRCPDPFYYMLWGEVIYFSMANLGFRSDKCNSGHYVITFQRLILMACLVQETMDSFVGSSLASLFLHCF
ncbi:hypothetical protein OIU79_004465 [Salix purpurea]|uniref:Uncharacterized protein n=1 Tax=Salix purpurea TaxID=77065 RepID=A0A9Q0Z9L9_SALPP|nr:hypothetical protein OIU79_004465 [Salix purpurea]